MGILWITQVRLLHFLLLLIAVVTLLYVVYVSSSPVIITPTVNNLYINYTNSIEKSSLHNDSNSNIIVTRNTTIFETSQPVSASTVVHNKSKLSHHHLQSPPDLTRGIPAEIIYEAGHMDVSSDICPHLGKHLKLLIAITSAPNHQTARMAIRQTWGHYGNRKDVAVTFMLGSTSNETLRHQIKEEEWMYGDIITGKFIDTYDNLTLKTISMLEWVDNYCSNAEFVLKTDDDMFINVPRLLTFIERHSPEQRNIYGRLAKKWKPIRNKKSKYYISLQQYKPAVFPDFTTGPAYLLPARLAKELYTAALNHTYFKLEDVFVTGIVANNLKIKRIHAPEFLNKRVSLTPCTVQRGISIHMVKGSEQFDLWKKLLDGLSKCK